MTMICHTNFVISYYCRWKCAHLGPFPLKINKRFSTTEDYESFCLVTNVIASKYKQKHLCTVDNFLLVSVWYLSAILQQNKKSFFITYPIHFLLRKLWDLFCAWLEPDCDFPDDGCYKILPRHLYGFTHWLAPDLHFFCPSLHQLLILT